MITFDDLVEDDKLEDTMSLLRDTEWLAFITFQFMRLTFTINMIKQFYFSRYFLINQNNCIFSYN